MKNQTNFTYKTISLRENGVFFLEKSLGKYSWWFGPSFKAFPPKIDWEAGKGGFLAISALKHLPFPQKKDIKTRKKRRRRRILIGKWRKGKSYERLGHYFGNRGNERHSQKLFQYSSFVILAIPWFLFISFFFFSTIAKTFRGNERHYL